MTTAALPKRPPSGRSRCHAGALALATLVGAGAEAQPQPMPAAAMMTQARTQEVYLDVRLDGEPTGMLSRFRDSGDGRLYARGQELAALGLDIGRMGVAPDQEVLLDVLPGLRYRYTPALQEVDLSIAPALRTTYRVDARGMAPTPPATPGRGLLLNYEIYAQTRRESPLAAWSEQRYFDRRGVFSNTGTLHWNDQMNSYVRFDTNWTHSDPQTLRSLQLGDAISSSLTWSRAVRLGGLQWRRNYNLRPDLITFPIPALGGTAAVPTAVDVYINNVRRYTGNVPTGPFVLNDITGISGAGLANVITRDALGRDVSTAIPIYIDTRLLAADLSSYSVELGFLRRNYGMRSFDYERSPAASASGRYGLSDAWTVEGHAEAASGLANAGVGLLARLGTAGVANASLSGSTGRQHGAQVGLGYQYLDEHYSLDIQAQRQLGDHGDLASLGGAPGVRSNTRATFSLPLGQGNTASLSYIGLRYRGADTAHVASASYLMSLAGQVVLSLSAFKDFSQNQGVGGFANLSIALGNISAGMSVGRQNGETQLGASAVRPADYGGGWGWGTQAGQARSSRYGRAWGQYLGRYGEAIATVEQYSGETSASLNLAGAVALMQGTAMPARRIHDGFALVSTDGTPGIPVMHQNRVIGRTNAAGYLLVPELNAYQRNDIEIDTLSLPASASIPVSSRTVVPQARSGVLAHFPILQQAAAVLLLADEAGGPLPVGAHVLHEESDEVGVVGYDSMTFLSRLSDRNVVVVTYEGGRCSAAFEYVRPDDGSLPTVGPVTCRKETPE